MIQLLLSRYRRFIGVHQESPQKRFNDALALHTNRTYGDLLMRFLVLGWLAFQTYTYHQMADRPVELFEPINWFDKLLMPIFPHWLVWYGVIGVAVFGNVRLIFNGSRKTERIVLAFLIMWVNCIRWKYGFFSHVGHIMVLYHLLGMFIPHKTKVPDEELVDYGMAVRWLFGGLLVTYTMSGLWKIGGLIYKIVWFPDAINWIHPLAMRLNSVVGYRDWDLPLDLVSVLYAVDWPWQIAFWLMLIIQVTSVLGALRTQVLPYLALGNILFHLVNIFLIHIEFYLSPMALLVIFFPYHLMVQQWKVNRKTFVKHQEKGIYQRKYQDSTKDLYTGYYAFREKKYDQNPLLWGWLFFPGLSLLAKPFFEPRG